MWSLERLSHLWDKESAAICLDSWESGEGASSCGGGVGAGGGHPTPRASRTFLLTVSPAYTWRLLCGPGGLRRMPVGPVWRVGPAGADREGMRMSAEIRASLLRLNSNGLQL